MANCTCNDLLHNGDHYCPIHGTFAKNLAQENAALCSRLAEAEKEREQDAKADAEIQDTVGKYMADVEALQSRVTVLEKALRDAKKDAEDWKSHWKMYRDAWVRELGGWLIPKAHEIDALVLTTRKRCVNLLLGNCRTPHWLGNPTADRKAIEQTPHPQGSDCREWKFSDAALTKGTKAEVEGR